jgi:hypothetical protein
MPCDAVPSFIDYIPRPPTSPTTIVIDENGFEPVLREVKSNNIRMKLIPSEVDHILPPIPEISEKTDNNISIKKENVIVISERFLNSLDKDVAEIAKNAVTKLNGSFSQMKQDRMVRLTNMHYLPRPTVIPLDGNNTVTTPIKRPINGCGCLPFSMKQIFFHPPKNI